MTLFEPLRREYPPPAELDPATALADPFQQFEAWMAAAIAAGLTEPNAMTLATADLAGQPSARMVLLKDVSQGGLVFFTNYLSRKGHELAVNPRAAAVFWWPPLVRQVRFEGTVSPVPAAESEAYFASRPRGSQLGAAASPQSRAIPDRSELEAAAAALAVRYADRPIPRPAHWGGYRLFPHAIEFWQGRPDRLHDRLRYERLASSAPPAAGPPSSETASVSAVPGLWHIQRLAP